MPTDRLVQQLHFIVEIDRLKGILRRTRLTDGSRRENSAEHSWHLAVMAILLQEYVQAPVDLLRVIKMLLVHDIVEIDADDTFCYDVAANQDKEERERRAAARLFGLLPEDQGAELRALWEEFEAQDSPEARYATALDRLQPLLHNHRNNGGTWRTAGVSHDRVLARMRPIETACPDLWPFVQRVIDEAIEEGVLEVGGDSA